MSNLKDFWHSGWLSKAFISGFVFMSLLFLTTLLVNVVNSENLVNAQSENDELQKQIEESNDYKEELESVSSQLEYRNEEYENLKNEYDEYKESMAVYEELSEEEAKNQAHKEKTEREERERKEAERKEKEEEERLAKEEEEKKAEQERKEKEEAEQEAKEAQGYETGITYEDLARNPDDNIGEKVKFSGKVIQVMENDSVIQIRMAVNDDYDAIILAELTEEQLDGSRILEDDQITIMGVSFGLYEYTATLGQQISVPAVIVDKLER